MAVNINKKIDFWQNKLLDLSKRNKLLNYKETKSSTLRIINPGIYEFWDDFVKNENPLEFPFYDEIEDEEENEEKDVSEADLLANQSIKDMQKTLRNLRNKSKIAIEEQGVNVLYLSFGFLKWSESNISEQNFLSPLILVPVSLTIESISSPYILSLHEDEILINPTLQYKLENDFGFSLPEFDEEMSLRDFIISINAMVSRNRWGIVEEVGLSLLSFLKINMYNDLLRHRESIINNTIVRAISGDVSAVNPLPNDIMNYDYDKNIKPIDVFQVVDADSSQQDAILCAKKGLSFVLQGPPGTGKSQTITNIIAECLADGKKVLFVSEKMAALDVVYNRLKIAGLNEFCLVLHSHKANKKSVLEQLETVLQLSKNKAELSDEVYFKLNTLEREREKLNDYARQLFIKVEPLGKSIYEVNGIIANLSNYKDVIFSIDGITNTDWGKYSRLVYTLEELKSSINRMSGDYTSNPWRDSNISHVSNELRHDIGAILPKLINKLNRYDIELLDIQREIHINFINSYSSIDKIITILKFIESSPVVLARWILEDDFEVLRKEIKQAETYQHEFLSMRQSLEIIYKRYSVHSSSLIFAKIEELGNAGHVENEKIKVYEFINNHIIYSKLSKMSNFSDLVPEIASMKETTKKIECAKSNLLAFFSDEIFEVNNDLINEENKFQQSNVFCYFRPEFKFDKIKRLDIYKTMAERTSKISILESIKNYDQQFNNKLDEINQLNTELKDLNCLVPQSEIKTSDNDTLIIRELEQIRQLTQENDIYQKIMGVVDFELIKKELDNVTQKIDRAHELKTKISENFEMNIFDLDIDGLLGRYRADYSSVFKFVKKSYRSDRKLFQSIYKRTSDKITDAIILDALVLLKELLDIRQWLNSNCNNLRNIFGDLFCEEDTDILLIVKHLEIYNKFKTCIQDLEEMHKISLKSHEEESKLILSYVCSCLKDLEKLREQINIESTNISRIFSCDYNSEKTDFDLIDHHLQVFDCLSEIESQLNHLYNIAIREQELESNLVTHFAFLYDGFDTSWKKISESLSWCESFREFVENNHLSKEFVVNACENKEFIRICSNNIQRLMQIKQDIGEELNWFTMLFGDDNEFKIINLSELRDRVKLCNDKLSLLEEWIDFRNARNSCREEGLSEYIEKIELEKINANYILPIFQKRFFRLWLDEILINYPAILNFRRSNHEKIICEFSSLDRIQFDIAKKRIRGKLINNLPSFDHFISGKDEIAILKRELCKKRKIMPIRKLFKKIPNLLPILKPCLMMSPLSVSLFLEAESYQFDTVIFDEASQVCTENAIGAISRGKQVIIAGDSKQLPPTNFFGASLSDADYDKEDEVDEDTYIYESILDEANLLPERTLRWHYRSRHEHLIAFSNSKIYKNSLITFPSNIDRSTDNGVEYIYVSDGFYDRGGKKGNVIEAKRVAEMVFEHFNKHPDRSIGVIAFGEVQQLAIDTCLRKMRLENKKYEDLFSEERREPFFVKNLENVQGDERDTIIFSIGYGKDSNGVFRMNFGPLSKNGGERRLNVAITRAKHNVKLVGSISSSDINIKDTSPEGTKLLRAYIEFAEKGVESLTQEIVENSNIEHDSTFERSVYNFLDGKGYKLVTKVGCSGYKIDMAIKHKSKSEEYVLGIECDGASYHTSRTARDRDRLRQDVLKEMGWKLYRIWSTDWIKDPVTEGEKLVEVVESALNNCENINNNIHKSDSKAIDDFVIYAEKTITEEELMNPYGFKEEKSVSFSDLHTDYNGYLTIEDCIIEVVSQRFPIHYDLLCKELAPLLGNEKATVKVKREVDCGLKNLESRIINKDNFLFPMVYDKIIPRKDNDRKIDYVSKEELAEVMICVLKKCIGATKEVLCIETAKAYNYNRMTHNISSAMDRTFDLLIQENRVGVVGGKVIPVEQF